LIHLNSEHQSSILWANSSERRDRYLVIELTPPPMLSEEQIGEIMDKVGASIKAAA
jgi:hypothetical protein